MATVKSATYGDENGSTDVTDAVSGNFKNGRADFVVNDSIVPLLVTSEKAELTDEEKADIKADAIKECGGNANDNQCIQATTNRISQAKLQDKIENQKRIGNIKGPRLTVTVIDEQGREKNIVVPKGQNFTFGQPPKKRVPSKWEVKAKDIAKLVVKNSLNIGYIVGGAILVLLWAFSAGATWRAFMIENYVKAGYLATAVAIIVPLSGFIITPVFYAFLKYFAQ